MRGYIYRSLVVMLTFAFGVSVVMMWRATDSKLFFPTTDGVQTSSDFYLPLPVDRQDFEDWTLGSCLGREPIVFVSIPNDDEIYIGKERVTLSEVSTNLIYKLNGRHPCKEIYVKTADFVRYRTFASVIDQIREVSNNRIWYSNARRREIKKSKSN